MKCAETVLKPLINCDETSFHFNALLCEDICTWIAVKLGFSALNWSAVKRDETAWNAMKLHMNCAEKCWNFDETIDKLRWNFDYTSSNRITVSSSCRPIKSRFHRPSKLEKWIRTILSVMQNIFGSETVIALTYTCDVIDLSQQHNEWSEFFCSECDWFEEVMLLSAGSSVCVMDCSLVRWAGGSFSCLRVKWLWFSWIDWVCYWARHTGWSRWCSCFCPFLPVRFPSKLCCEGRRVLNFPLNCSERNRSGVQNELDERGGLRSWGGDDRQSQQLLLKL